MKLSIIFLALIYLSYDLCQSQTAEIFFSSSIAEMVYLQHLKHLLVSKLELYAKELKDKLQVVENGIAQLGIQLKNDIGNREDHGMNYFRTLRRQKFDWAHWLNFMKQDVATAAQEQIQEMRQYLPNQDDYYDAINSVFLILDVYLIEPQEFAEGLLRGRQYKSRLDALDCYALAQFTLKNKYYTKAKEWLNLSWDYHAELDELQQKYYKLMGFDPVEFMSNYGENLMRLFISADKKLIVEKDTYLPGHRECCRGEYKYSKRLSCYYEFKEDFFLRLAPFKVEPLHRNPFVAVYHDVLYDSEIAELKRLAVPTMTRSFIYSNDRSRNENSNLRTSNSVFLSDSASSVVKTINRRVMDITKLNVSTESSNELQVMNYGLGGHYGPHYDWFGPHYPLHRGDRIATVLFYLSDVSQGGATVFPILQLSYFPVKGSALIFRNLNNDMSGDVKTLHSGCPVLFGSKWMAAKWIFSADQMFRSPCLTDKSVYK